MDKKFFMTSGRPWRYHKGLDWYMGGGVHVEVPLQPLWARIDELALDLHQNRLNSNTNSSWSSSGSQHVGDSGHKADVGLSNQSELATHQDLGILMFGTGMTVDVGHKSTHIGVPHDHEGLDNNMAMKLEPTIRLGIGPKMDKKRTEIILMYRVNKYCLLLVSSRSSSWCA